MSEAIPGVAIQRQYWTGPSAQPGRKSGFQITNFDDLSIDDCFCWSGIASMSGWRTTAVRVMHGLVGAVIVLLLMVNAAPAREQSDVVTLRNGDRLTGEIIRVEYNRLELKTDALGTVYVEMPRVSGISSHATFLAEQLNGHKVFGQLGGGEDRLSVQYGTELTEMPLADLARLGPVDDSFLGRVRGSASMGASFAKSTSIATSNFRFDAEYVDKNLIASLSTSVDLTSSKDTGTSQRIRVDFSPRFLLEGTDFWAGVTSFERNETLGLDSRWQLGLARGRSLLRVTDNNIVVYLGLVGSRETAKNSERTQSNLEGVAGLDWRIYRFTTPQTTLNSTLVMFPGITDAGRVRARVDVLLKRKFGSSWTLNLSLYDDYDSRPQSSTGTDNDYGITTGIGVTF